MTQQVDGGEREGEAVTPEAPRRGALLAGVALAGLCLGVMAWLHRPLWPQVGEALPASAFHPGHVWFFEHLARVLSGERPLSTTTPLLAWPAGAELRPIGLGPALLSLPLRAALGTLAAYNLTVWLSPALSGLAAWAFARRLTRAGPWTAAAAALPFALTPYALGCLASGQVAKLQLWALVLPLHAALAFTRGGGAARALALALATALTTFTSPSIGLLLPFALGLVALAGPWRRGAVALGVAALSMLPAGAFYAGSGARSLGGEVVRGTQPALRPALDADVAYAIARFDGTILPPDSLPRLASDAVHLTYLPWPLWLGALLALRARGRGLAWGFVLVGGALAVGEVAWWDEGPWTHDGRRVWLPARALYALGYPLAASGMYYRAIALVALGLSLALAAAAARLGGGRGLLLAAALGLGASAEGLRASAGLFPRDPQVVLPGEVLAELAADPAPGAVLTLPLEHHGNDAQDALVAAALHGRATTAAPLLMRRDELPYLARLDRQLGEALAGPGAAEALAAMGFRYVIWHEIVCDGGPGREAVLRALGPPWRRSARAMVWRLPSPAGADAL